jgi:hypothetical protein
MENERDGIYREYRHIPRVSGSPVAHPSVPETKTDLASSWCRTTFDLNIPVGHDIPQVVRLHENSRNANPHGTDY